MSSRWFKPFRRMSGTLLGVLLVPLSWENVYLDFPVKRQAGPAQEVDAGSPPAPPAAAQRLVREP